MENEQINPKSNDQIESEWSNMDVRGDPLDYYDEYSPNIDSVADLKQQHPAKQLEYLSSTLEAARANGATVYLETSKVFDSVADDEDFSPLIRIVAKIGKAKISNDFAEGENSSVDPATFGYSTIVTPEMISEGALDTKIAAMNEVELLAELDSVKIDDLEAEDTDESEFMSSISYEAELKLALEKIYFARNQEKLHREFPQLPQTAQLVKIASDAVATVSFQEKYDDEAWFALTGDIDLLFDASGNLIPTESNEDGESDIDADTLSYLKTVHGDETIKSYIEGILNLRLSETPLKSEGALLRFMAGANNERFDALCTTFQRLDDKELRQKLLENFVATDFGDDFGDALLEIADSDKISDEQLGEILNGINSCRQSIAGITENYHDFDGGSFAHEYARAANERLTDVIAVFRKIATDGTASAEVEWLGEIKFDYDEAIEALKYEADSLSIINGTLNDIRVGKSGAFAEQVLNPDETRGRSLYNFYSPEHGYVLLYTRPEGSGTFDPMLEHGKERSRYDGESKNVGVEASISLTTDPVSPFSLPNPYRPNRHELKDLNHYDHSTMNKVSALRLDREGRAPGMPADDPNRDPINPIGMVSVDLAAIGDRFDTPSGKIARLVSVGNKIRQVETGTNSSLNHNTRWFDQDKYGTAGGFRELVEYIDSLVKNWCDACPPGKTEGFRRAARDTKRRRGHKAIRGAA